LYRRRTKGDIWRVWVYYDELKEVFGGYGYYNEQRKIFGGHAYYVELNEIFGIIT